MRFGPRVLPTKLKFAKFLLTFFDIIFPSRKRSHFKNFFEKFKDRYTLSNLCKFTLLAVIIKYFLQSILFPFKQNDKHWLYFF